MRLIWIALSMTLVGCSQTPNQPIVEDPLWQSGVLENGLKYHIYPTDNSDVAVRFHLKVGSFQETESEKGYAHFLEHMAFNGSKHFAANEVIATFAEEGASFGPDLNAYTGYHFTNYKLDLPNAELLPQALLWMRDVADGLTLDPKEIKKEKGVVLSEIRMSRPEIKPLFDKAYEAWISGTAYQDKDVLGSPESVKGITEAGLRAFYELWYQPQNAELVVTGNIDPVALEGLIAEKFRSWQPSNDVALTIPRDIGLNESDLILEVGEGESPGIHVSYPLNAVGIKDHQGQHIVWLNDIVRSVIEQRLNAAFLNSATPSHYYYSSVDIMHYDYLLSAGVAMDTKHREQAHKLLIQTLASLRDHGISQDELNVAIAGYQGALDNIEATHEQLTSSQNANDYVFAIEQNDGFQSKEDLIVSYRNFLANTDRHRVNRHLNQILSVPPYFLIGAGSEENTTEMTQYLAELKKALKSEGVKPLVLDSDQDSFSQPDAVGDILAQQETREDMTIWNLANGIEVWFKQNPESGKRVDLFYVSLGGKAALPEALYPALEVTLPVAMRSGVGEFSAAELDAYLRKHNIEILPFTDHTSHGIRATTPKENLSEVLGAIYAITKEFKIDERQIEVVKEEVASKRAAFFATPVGEWIRAVNRNGYQGQSRHILADSKAYSRVTKQDLLDVHHELFQKNRNTRLVIVADADPAQISELVRRYVAPIQLEVGAKPEFDIAYNPAPKPYIQMDTRDENKSHYIARITNTQPLFRDTKTVFAEDVLNRIVNQKLLKHIREDLGLAYSINAYSIMQDGEPNTDWFVEVELAPDDVEKAKVAIERVMTELPNSITRAEVKTAAKQLKSDLQPLKTNGATQAYMLTRYLTFDFGIDDLLAVDKTADSITLQQIKALAEHSFGRETRWSVHVLMPKK